ncbi:hypothetical protein SAY87_023834 [Trapa incisa]|uniref:Uncharacterized protein n=1 Tax=Trapa incisa TaxID=236973 RepID=A0AAN7KT74_9MYRT|nr:hypothetical protein SAY87_023834 [Trapa incisa]
MQATEDNERIRSDRTRYYSSNIMDPFYYTLRLFGSMLYKKMAVYACRKRAYEYCSCSVHCSSPESESSAEVQEQRLASWSWEKKEGGWLQSMEGCSLDFICGPLFFNMYIT